MASGRGLDAVGVDAAPTAIDRARRKAEERGVQARFLVMDALAMDQLDETFDTILDCGLFHVLTDDDRPRYVVSLRAVTKRGSRFHLLCFSDRVPGTVGPRRITREEIAATFSKDWQIDEIRHDVIEITTGAGIPAWLASMTRR